jgi:hypothetical protein
LQNITPPEVPSLGAATAGDVDSVKMLFEAGDTEERAEKLNFFLEGFCALLENMKAH